MKFSLKIIVKIKEEGASLVAQQIRICLPMQETGVCSLVWEIQHTLEQLNLCTTTTKAVLQSLGGTTTEAVLQSLGGHNY